MWAEFPLPRFYAQGMGNGSRSAPSEGKVVCMNAIKMVWACFEPVDRMRQGAFDESLQANLQVIGITSNRLPAAIRYKAFSHTPRSMQSLVNSGKRRM
jgi:hypothetical protein